MARAGARLGPSVMPPLCHFSGMRLVFSHVGLLPAPARGAGLFALTPAWIRAERSKRGRELRQVNHRARALQILARGGDIEIEQILPGPSRHGARFELGQIDVAQREHAQRLEQRAGRALQREDEARLVGWSERHALPRDRQEARDVVVVVLNRRCAATRGRRAYRHAPTRSPPCRGAARRAPSSRCPPCRRWRSLRPARRPRRNSSHCASACGCDSTRRHFLERHPGSASRLWTTGTCTSPTIDRSRSHEQVVIAVNRSADGILDRDDAERDRPVVDRRRTPRRMSGTGADRHPGISRSTAASLNAPGSP